MDVDEQEQDDEQEMAEASASAAAGAPLGVPRKRFEVKKVLLSMFTVVAL